MRFDVTSSPSSPEFPIYAMPPNFHRRVADALADDALRATLTRSTGLLRQQQAAGFADSAPFEELQAAARALRQDALDRLPALLVQLEAQARARGVEVFWAPDAAAARRYILALAEARRVRQVVRSHAAAVEEIGLDAALADAHINVILTQVGDYILHLAGDTPSHPVHPALHWRKEAVTQLFEQHLDVPQTLDIQSLANVVRFKLRRPTLEAALSVGGVALAVAETGTLALASGDDRLAVASTPIHVAVMGIEQVTAALEDLALFLPLYARSAGGQSMPDHALLLEGPAPADAADGPRELHLVILDNGRSDLLRWGYGEALTCIHCGACHNVCPVYREIGGQAYSPRGGGPIDSVTLPLLPSLPVQETAGRWPTAARDRRQDAQPAVQPGAEPRPAPALRGAPLAPLPHASTLCGACSAVCPVGIDIPRLLIRLRGDLAAAGELGKRERMLRRLYRWGTQDAANLPRLHRLLRSARLLPDWPQPASQTFHARWRERRGL